MSNVAQALINPNYAEFLQLSPTAEAQAALLAVYTAFYNFSGVPYDPTKVVAIIRDEYINVARQRIKGLDLSGSYKFDLGRSEEPTSELQSLMSISYAVFCLQKKNKHKFSTGCNNQINS